MTVARMIELAAAVAILAAAVFFYRRRDPGGGNSYGNQGAVILFVVAAIVGVHALGGLDYHPSAAELDDMKARAQ